MSRLSRILRVEDSNVPSLSHPPEDVPPDMSSDSRNEHRVARLTPMAKKRHSRLSEKLRGQTSTSANPRRRHTVSSVHFPSPVERSYSNSNETLKARHSPGRRSKRKTFDRRTQDIEPMSRPCVRPTAVVSTPRLMNARAISIVIPLSIPPLPLINEGSASITLTSMSTGPSSSNLSASATSGSSSQTTISVSSSLSSSSVFSQTNASSNTASSTRISSSQSTSQSLRREYPSSATPSTTPPADPSTSTSGASPTWSPESTTSKQDCNYSAYLSCPIDTSTQSPDDPRPTVEIPNAISVDGFLSSRGHGGSPTSSTGGPTPKLGQPGKDESPFARNKGAIIGVSFASVIVLTLLSLLTFLICRRYRRRIVNHSRLIIAPLLNKGNTHSRNNSRASSKQNLMDTPISRPVDVLHRQSGSGSAFSFVFADIPPIDGEDGPMLDSGPIRRHRPSAPSVQIPSTTLAPLFDKHTHNAIGASKVSFATSGSATTARNADVSPMMTSYQLGSPTMQPLLSSNSTTRTLVTVNKTPPSSATQSSFSPTSAPLSSATHSQAARRTVADGSIQPSISLNGGPLGTYNASYPTPPWLHRTVTNQSANSFLTLTPEPSTPGMDNDRRLPTDGLLHPSLRGRALGYFDQGPSTSSLLDHIDYSRPISGMVRNGVIPQGSSTTIPTVESNISQDGHSAEVDGFPSRTVDRAFAV